MAAEADTQIFTVCVYDHPQTQEEVEGPALLGNWLRRAAASST